MNSKTIRSIAEDCRIRMLWDYNLNNRQKLGSPVGVDYVVDHIEMDESKFGKRKYHRGSRCKGVWVFGMAEAIKIGENKFKAGRIFLFTVPNRSGATLLPIIKANCVEGVIIRSDGWAGYNGLHPVDVPLADGTYADNLEDYTTDMHVSQHQVVNHSQGFATIDQILGKLDQYKLDRRNLDHGEERGVTKIPKR